MPKQDTPSKPTTPPIEMSRRRPSVWLRFLLVVAALLAFDLGLKDWSFNHIADTPIRVQTAESGGPQVLIPDGEGGDWKVVSRTGPNGEPPRIPHHDPTVVMPGGLNLQLTLNTGAVFGTGQGGRPIFILVSAVAVVVIVVLLYRSPAKAWFYHAGLAMILAGALGNLYDRVRFSAVRDMLHMLPEVDLPFGLAWPGGATGVWPWIFNVADVALIAGVASVLLVSYASDRKQIQANAGAKSK